MKKAIARQIIEIYVTFLVIHSISSQKFDSKQPIKPQIFSPQSPMANNRMSRSEQIEAQEKLMYKTVEQKVPINTKFTNFIFTVQGVQDFILNLPIAQQVVLSMFTYEMKNNAYMRPQNVQNQAPIRIMIYENNNRLIFQSRFFYQIFIAFQGQELSTYTIRFTNQGNQKLITMNIKKVTQTTHIDQVITSTALSQHASRASQLLDQFKFLTNAFERYSLINLQAIKAVISNLNVYYYWNILETILASLVCIIQITFISRVCKTESIV